MIVKNLSWQYAEQFMRLAFGIFVGAWTARYLGPEVFGELNVALSITAIAAITSNLGLKSILVKELVAYDANYSTILSSSLFLKLISSLMIIFLTYTLVYFASDGSFNNRHKILLILILSSVFSASDLLASAFQANMKNHLVAISKIAVLLITVFLKVMVFIHDGGLIALAIIILTEHAATFCIILSIYKMKLPNFTLLSINYKYCIVLIQKSLPLLVSSLSIILYTKSDLLMLQWFADPKYVGLYASGTRISEAIAALSPLLVSTLFPILLKLNNSNIEESYEFFKRILNALVVVSVILMIPIYFAADIMILTLYGELYYESAIVLRVHIFSIIFVYWGVATSYWQIANGLQIFNMQRALFGLIINIVLNLVLIPSFGMVGAASATVLSQFSANFLFDFGHSEFKRVRYAKLWSLSPYNMLNILSHISLLQSKTENKY